LERMKDTVHAFFKRRASHPPRVGGVLELPGGARARVTGRHDLFFELRLEGGIAFDDYLERHGAVPLPPYIERLATADGQTRYQTVYPRHAGAVAAPTAGLHFDEPLLAVLAEVGIAFAHVTLHIGAGTFQ